MLLSDLIWPGDALATLSHFAERATAVIVVQVLAEVDVNPMERGNIRLVNSETDEVQEIFVDAVAEKRYCSALARHQENWREFAKRHRRDADAIAGMNGDKLTNPRRQTHRPGRFCP